MTEQRRCVGGPTARSCRCPDLGGRKLRAVTPYDDDDDWVGTPPEGRYSRDRANPEFRWRQRPVGIAAAGLAVVIVVLLLIALLH